MKTIALDDKAGAWSATTKSGVTISKIQTGYICGIRDCEVRIARGTKVEGSASLCDSLRVWRVVDDRLNACGKIIDLRIY